MPQESKKQRELRGVITCQSCDGTGFVDDKECYICNGTPLIDFSNFTARMILLSDYQRLNRALNRKITALQGELAQLKRAA